LPNKLMYL